VCHFVRLLTGFGKKSGTSEIANIHKGFMATQATRSYGGKPGKGEF
jgi:hypothetical protein